MRVCAVIPAYNEEAHVADVVRGVREQGLDVMIVDDCSSDATPSRAREAGAELVRHEVNKGKGEALRTGFARAMELGYDAVLTLDADGQHDPKEVPRFLNAAPRADIVLGSRMAEVSTMPRVRLWSNLFSSWVVSRLAGTKITDSQSGYRLLKRNVIEGIDYSASRFDAESEILVEACRMGFRLVEVPVSTIYADEESKIHPIVDTVRFFRMVARLSKRVREMRRARGR